MASIVAVALGAVLAATVGDAVLVGAAVAVALGAINIRSEEILGQMWMYYDDARASTVLVVARACNKPCVASIVAVALGAVVAATVGDAVLVGAAVAVALGSILYTSQ